MGLFRTMKQFFINMLDMNSEEDIFQEEQQWLEAEISVLKQEIREVSFKSRRCLEQCIEAVALLKDYAQKNGQGNNKKLSKKIAEFENQISEYAAWLDEYEGRYGIDMQE